MPKDQVVTRFAPSPTGYLHIGNARTALFSWAYTRRHGGVLILRIEDTDVARSTAQSSRGIIEDMQWLGLDWDEGPNAEAKDIYDPAGQKGPHGPYFQSQRSEIYQRYLQRFAQMGRAYRCFTPAEQIKAERDKAMAEKRPYKYDRTEALSLSEAQQEKLIKEGKPFVWRFRMPDSDITVHDLVLGDVTVKREELEDFIIMKSEAAGSGPTFHFANVVDDAEMGVTLVLRGQEHLINTPRHVAMFDALGLPSPKYAHMPLIFNPDGKKMSKRDPAKAARAACQVWLKIAGNTPDKLWDLVQKSSGPASDKQPKIDLATLKGFLEKKNDEAHVAVALAGVLGIHLPEIYVHDFRASGYLPEVLLNYVALLGWSPGENVERFDLNYLKENFDVERIGKSNARFDRAKLLAFNAEAIAKLSAQEFLARWRAHLAEFHPEFLAHFDDERLKLLAEAYRSRSRTLDEPVAAGQFFVVREEELVYDPAAIKKVLEKNDRAGYALLRNARASLAACDPWTPETIHAALEGLAGKLGRPVGDIAQPLRVAVTGGMVSPPIDQTLGVLGEKAAMARIERCLVMEEGG